MSLRSGLAVLALALAGCGAAQATPQRQTSAPTGAGSAACTPPGSRTLIHDREASIYQLGKSVYGCSFGAGPSRTYRLGSADVCVNSDRVGPITLAGRIAAYGVQRCGVDTGTAEVIVRRLSDGRSLRTAAATATVPGPESIQAVDSVVVRADGAVGWIGEAHSIVRRGAVVQVRRLDRTGQSELDHGRGIAVGSLRLSGSRMTWSHSGRERSATLS